MAMDIEPVDIFANEEELREARCVLAASDPENCSYLQGYVKRQAVFACNTCNSSAAEPTGICLACANKCHNGHDIFELYTKRNFRCDCGNGKFGEFKCQLFPAKDKENAGNHYNHNFNGCYCSCDRPYPDKDDQINDEMIQCVVCEDWFHSRHLGCAIVEPEELQEMVCEACMNKTPFLWTYAAHLTAPPEDTPLEEEGDIEEGAEREGSESSQSASALSVSADQTNHNEVGEGSSPHKQTQSGMAGSPALARSVVCKLKDLQVRGLERLRTGAVFWPYSWRSELCTCISCKKTYVATNVQFLMDQSDTILAYENRGLEEPFGQHPLMALMNSMDRMQQLEVIYGFKELTPSVTAFLDQLVAEGKNVTVEAVNQFFEELQASKTQNQ